MAALIYMREDFASGAAKAGNTDGYPGTTKKQSIKPTHLSECISVVSYLLHVFQSVLHS